MNYMRTLAHMYIALFILLFVAMLWGILGKRANPLPKLEQVPVTVTKAEIRSIPMQIEAVGNVFPYESVVIKSRIDSQLLKVNFQAGSTVQKDQVLFELDDRLLKSQLAQLEATLKQDEAQK